MSTNASPQFVPPEVPDDFQFKGKPSQIVKAIFDLLKNGRITGFIGGEGDSSFDIAQIQQQLNNQATQIGTLTKARRFFRLDTVHNGVVVVPFGLTPMPTDNYSVNVSFIGPSGTLRGFEWAIVDGSKTKNQVSIRTNASDNTISNYDIEVVVQEN